MREARRCRAAAALVEPRPPADPRDDRSDDDRHDHRRVPGVQRGHGDDGRRPEQLQPGARHLALPAGFVTRQLRLRRRHRRCRSSSSRMLAGAAQLWYTRGGEWNGDRAGTVGRGQRVPRRLRTFLWAFLVCLGIVVVYPLLWMVLNGFRTNARSSRPVRPADELVVGATTSRPGTRACGTTSRSACWSPSVRRSAPCSSAPGRPSA